MSTVDKPKSYVRPMSGWWLKNPFYIKYMVREATSIFVGIYAVVLLEGLMAVAEGETDFNNWLAAMHSPLAIGFHIVALAAALYHTVTWFSVAPKVAPILFIGKKRIQPSAITAAQYVVAVIVYLLLFWMILGA